MKKVALVGSTGSVGRQVLNVLKRYGDRFGLAAMVARGSAAAFQGQLEEFRPAYAALTDSEAAKNIKDIPCGVRFFSGKGAGIKAIEECGADIIFVACGGFAGLEYSMKAASLGATLALANKESLVCGGELLAPIAQKLAPVDSEHSALWQCLNFRKESPFSRLVITASGGPFRGRKWEELKGVTIKEATAHPTWKMGAKITVDSATLLNKGYEVIEAHYLYSAPYDKITAVIHPQSVVHSMVEFADGAVMAQLSRPDMELPIQLALTYPERLRTNIGNLDFAKAFSLDFAPLNRGDYPMFDLALHCGEAGGVLPTALNAASEIADGAFLRGEIGFTDIYGVCAKVVEKTSAGRVESFEQLCGEDGRARALAEQFVKEVR